MWKQSTTGGGCCLNSFCKGYEVQMDVERESETERETATLVFCSHHRQGLQTCVVEGLDEMSSAPLVLKGCRSPAGGRDIAACYEHTGPALPLPAALRWLRTCDAPRRRRRLHETTAWRSRWRWTRMDLRGCGPPGAGRPASFPAPRAWSGWSTWGPGPLSGYPRAPRWC